MSPTQGNQVWAAMNATETTEATIGTITVPPSGVRAITGVYGTVLQPTATAGETLSGYFKITPATGSVGVCKFPLQNVYGPAGTLAATAGVSTPNIIPVNIPVVPTDTITITAALNKVATGTAEVQAGVIFE